jgi:hypothetical protein
MAERLDPHATSVTLQATRRQKSVSPRFKPRQVSVA